MVLALADDETRCVVPPERSVRRAPSRAAAMVVDLVALLIAQVLLVRGVGGVSQPTLVGVLASGPIWLLSLAHHDRHRSRRGTRPLLRAGATAATCTIAVAGILGADGAWLAVVVASEAIGIVLVRRLTRRRIGRRDDATVVIGTEAEATALATALESDETRTCRVIGIVDPTPIGLDVPGSRRAAAELAGAIVAAGATSAVLAADAIGPTSCNALARELNEAGLQVEVASTLCDLSSRRLSIGSLGRFTTLHLTPVRRHGWRRTAKRGIDLVGAATALVLLAPPIALIALAVRFTSPGPVIFRQERVGRDGSRFLMLKFRTMFVASEDLVIDLRQADDGSTLFKPAHDPRVTSVGRVLRKLSIDELPQLWNVLRGEMSLVGPRPALASEMEHWSPELHSRLRVPPGITGLWQVDRRDWSMEHYARLDLYYVDNWSLRTDLAIVGRTIPRVLLGRGNR